MTDDNTKMDKLRSATKKLAAGAKKAGKRYNEYSKRAAEKLEDADDDMTERASGMDGLGFTDSDDDRGEPGFADDWDDMVGFGGEDVVGFIGEDEDGWGVIGTGDEDDEVDDWLGGW